MLLPSSDADGKSEATMLVMGLADAVVTAVQTFREGMRIPLGVQEVTRDGLRKWWKQADPQLRMQFIQKNGVEQTLEMLGPGVTDRGNGGA